jgi:hypothetical protein
MAGTGIPAPDVAVLFQAFLLPILLSLGLRGSSHGQDAQPAAKFEQPWVTTTRALLRLGLIVALVSLGAEYYQRWTRLALGPQKAVQRKTPADYFVNPPKSLVTDAESARRRLLGKPLWVKEGYRWIHEPQGGVLGPLEQVVPSGVHERDGDVYLDFSRDGAPATVQISFQGRFFTDEIFYLKDPKELFDHWPPEAWEKIAAHRVEEGMTEHQVAFSVGAASGVRASPDQSVRIVDYTLCKNAGLPPVRVTFHDGVARKVEPLNEEAAGAGG